MKRTEICWSQNNESLKASLIEAELQRDREKWGAQQRQRILKKKRKKKKTNFRP
jgi:hypothetical protein